MQVDEKPIVPRPRNLDANFVDDDELQAALARSRRAKLQKHKKLSPEEIAKQSTCIVLVPRRLILMEMRYQSLSSVQSPKRRTSSW